MIKQWMMAAVASLPLVALAADPAASAPAAATSAAPVASPAPAAPSATATVKSDAPKARKPHSRLRTLQTNCNNMADQKKLVSEERKKYIADCMRTH